VFTTDTKEEAEALIALACPTNTAGQHIAPELADEQNMENLQAFSARLERLYKKIKWRPMPRLGCFPKNSLK